MALQITNSIKNKLRVSFLTLIALSIFGALISFRMINRVNTYQASKEVVNELMSELNEARKAEKDVLLYDRRTIDFLEDGESRYVAEHREHLDNLKALVTQLHEDPVVAELALEETLAEIERQTNAYERTFLELVRQMVIRGFKDHGLEGEMRDFVHALQACESPEEQVYAFQLRRHEKDFFLRQDDKYVERLHETTDDFLTYLAGKPQPHMTEEYLYRVTNGIQAYRNHFDRIVRVDRIIGLTDQEGLRGRLQVQAHLVEPQTSYLASEINARATALRANAEFAMVIAFGLLLLGGVIMSLVLSGAISRPIILLDSVITDILKGNQGAEAKLEAARMPKDEIGRLMRNFQSMLRAQNKNMALITEKNAKLEKAKEADRKRSWSVEGLAMFGEILKNSDHLQRTSDEIIGTLVKYLKASQGALFMVKSSEDEAYLEMVSCYAWERHKKTGQRIGYGDGLVGTAWRDSETLYFTEIPENYLNIRSGLGLAPPKALLIVPIRTQNECIGVVELASFREFAPHEIEFLEKLAERIATTLSAAKLQDRTRQLLHESQQMTEELQAQEEEMRQNMEELQATQEEMKRSTGEMQEAANALQNQLKLHQEIAGRVYDGIVITNERLGIEYTNEYARQRLAYSHKELQALAVDRIFVEDVPGMVQSLENDPSFILNRVSETRPEQLLDKARQAVAVHLVVMQLQANGARYYAFLFQPRTKKPPRTVGQHQRGRPTEHVQ